LDAAPASDIVARENTNLSVIGEFTARYRNIINNTAIQERVQSLRGSVKENLKFQGLKKVEIDLY
jgi:hypothetical protein